LLSRAGLVSVGIAPGGPIEAGSWRPGGLVGDFEQLAWPFGNAHTRIVVGWERVLAFNRDGAAVRHVLCRRDHDAFSLRITQGLAAALSDVVITVPYADLRRKGVCRTRQGDSVQMRRGQDYETFDERPDSIYMRNVRSGDAIVVGRGPPTTAIASCSPIVHPKATAFSPSRRLTEVLRGPGQSPPRLSELTPLFRKLSRQIAVLPDPQRSDLRTIRVGAMLVRNGLARHVRFLSAQELVDPDCFSAKRFAVAVYISSAWYWQTVKKERDADEALVRFLNDGGLLVVMASGPWPFFYNQDRKVLATAHTFGMSVCGRGPWPAGAHAADAVQGGWERPPADRTLTFHVCPNQNLIKSVPTKFAYPAPGEADQRWRPNVHKCPEGAVYTPLITLRDETGKSYCEGAALIEFKGEQFQGARVVRVWCSLPAMPEIGEGIVHDVFRYALSTVKPREGLAEAAGAALPFSDDFTSYKEGSDGQPRWRLTGGKWRIEKGTFVAQDCNCPGYQAVGAYCGSDLWTDYELSLKFKIDSRSTDWKDGPWIGVRCNEAGDGYYLNFADREVQLHKISYGVSSNERRPLARPAWKPDNRWHELAVRVQANGLSATLDGEKLFSVRDDMFLGILSRRCGGIVLSARKWPRARGQMVVRFDEVVVRELEKRE